MKAKLSLQPSLARTSLGVTVVAALLSLSAASAAQAPAGEPVPKLNDRHPFLGPDARTSEYPVRIPMKPVAETGPILLKKSPGGLRRVEADGRRTASPP